MSKLKEIRIQEVRSGDLLAWREEKFSRFSSACLSVVKYLTKSVYGHVGVAWKCHDGLNEELFVIEATLPKIRASRVSLSSMVDVVSFKLEWTEDRKKFLTSKIGQSYSLMDAVKAQMGIPLERDDEYQCVELAHYFYEECGIRLEHDFTPGGIVDAARRVNLTDVRRLVF